MSSLSGKRRASKAGSWYEDSPEILEAQLDGWLEDVPESVEDQGLPIPGARVIIAPHAGYSYSGPCAAWAYKALDVSNAKRIFLLGPSHTLYLPGCAITSRAKYATPFGDFEIDEEVVEELRNTGKFDDWSPRAEEDEHSLELHLPYIYKALQRSPAFKSPAEFPKLIPVLVGNTNSRKEEEYGKIFSNYLRDPTSVFVISSDFCHWGLRFQYTRYLAQGGPTDGVDLMPESTPTKVMDPKIYQSIAMLDERCMSAIGTGSYETFQRELRKTQNTICGRHPIGIIMCAIEFLREQEVLGEEEGRFKWLKYERSEDIVGIRQSSVSYVSGCAVVDCKHTS